MCHDRRSDNHSSHDQVRGEGGGMLKRALLIGFVTALVRAVVGQLLDLVRS